MHGANGATFSMWLTKVLKKWEKGWKDQLSYASCYK